MSITPNIFLKAKASEKIDKNTPEDNIPNKNITLKEITPLIISKPGIEHKKLIEESNQKGAATPGSIQQQYSTFRLERVDQNAERSDKPVNELIPVEEHSAGGIVYNENKCAAIISRTNRRGKEEWCFPKGHLENSENPEQAAVREVQEETGLTSKIVNLVGIVDYNFSVGEYRVHKKVHHFALESISGSILQRNDPDGEVSRILWIPFSKLQDVLTYENERKLARLFVSSIDLD